MAATASADEFRPLVSDGMVLSNEGGRWSVSLHEPAARQRLTAADPVPVPAR